MQANETNETTAATRPTDQEYSALIGNLSRALLAMENAESLLDAQQSGLAAVWSDKALSIQNSIKTLTLLVREGWDAQ